MLRNCAYVDAYANTADIDLEIMHSSNHVSYAQRRFPLRELELKLDYSPLSFRFISTSPEFFTTRRKIVADNRQIFEDRERE